MYGGTKTEMERLIADASKMTDVQNELGIAVKEGDMSFANIANAISVVQKNLGIMGTTQKEAEKTIQGSTASMKSAWQNMLTGMADENSNFETLATNFVSTLISEDGQGGVLGTIIPRIGQVVQGMSNALQTTIPMLIQKVVPLIQQQFPIIITAIQTGLQTMLQIMPQIVSVFSQLIPQIVSTIIGLLPEVVSAGMQILTGIIQGITEALPELIGMLPDVIDGIVTTLIDNLPLIIDAGIELLTALTDGIINAIPQMVARLPEIINRIIGTLTGLIPKIIQTGVQLLIALVQNMPAIINGLVNAMPVLVSGLISGLLQNLPAIISAGVQLLIALVQNLPAIIQGVLRAVPQIISALVTGFGQGVSSMASVGLNLVKGIWNGISNATGWILSKIRGFGQAVLNGLRSFFGIHSPSTVFRDEIGQNLALGVGEGFSDEMRNVTTQMQRSIPTNFDTTATINGVSGARYGSNSSTDLVSAFKEALSQMKIVLDDEVAGQFVENTVTRVIYA